MNSLVLENASFAYPSRPDRQVLNRISLSLPLSGRALVLGGNGSGKTALARLLAGLDSPSTGSVRWPDTAVGMRAGVVFEQPEFQLQGFSVAEELAGGLLYRGVERCEAERLASEGARKFGIDNLIELDLDELDSRDKLAVLIVAFLILEPRLLVLDFSLTELDSGFRKKLLSVCGGAGQPALAVLSRRAEDLALLEGAILYTLRGGSLEPFPPDTTGSAALEFLRAAGVAFPWHVRHQDELSAGTGWSWLTPLER